MSVAFTSREALQTVLADLGERQRRVYDCVAQWDGAHDTCPSIEDIGRTLSMQHSAVSARVNELLKSGAIVLAPFKTNASGCRARTYRALVFRPFNPPRKDAPQQDMFAGSHSRGVEPFQRTA